MPLEKSAYDPNAHTRERQTDRNQQKQIKMDENTNKNRWRLKPEFLRTTD
jgi:hypothetical protein